MSPLRNGAEAYIEARSLTQTNRLVEHYAKYTGVPTEKLEAAIGAAIDAVYTNRDGGGNMHSAGAEAAVAALEAFGAI